MQTEPDKSFPNMELLRSILANQAKLDKLIYDLMPKYYVGEKKGSKAIENLKDK